jgi:DtxR family Mn-dependent transcriptional regulator
MQVLLTLAAFTLLAVAVVWVGHHLAARWRRARRLTARARIEDALKHLHASELSGTLATAQSLAGHLGTTSRRAVDAIATMEQGGLIYSTGAGLRLTPAGATLALRVIRAHRLLERYLADELRVPLEQVHTAADRREHSLTVEEADELEVRLGYPRTDPHGDPIPTSSGALAAVEATALTDWPVARPAEIVHVEDEPPEIFAQIVAAGLQPGMHIEVFDRNEQSVVVWDGEREHVLAPLVASSVSVADLSHPVQPPLRLSGLRPGESGRVVALKCEGFNRRRLLDLGLMPGAVVECAYPAPLGEPTAYRVRGALIALRREQADEIEIERVA